ncbi:MAG: hypothetical protein FWD82_02065 [Defluviitaleaceae bacterium]|nr:hypothetical protein [Defluviitaleaceae bacterium]
MNDQNFKTVEEKRLEQSANIMTATLIIIGGITFITGVVLFFTLSSNHYPISVAIIFAGLIVMALSRSARRSIKNSNPNAYFKKLAKRYGNLENDLNHINTELRNAENTMQIAKFTITENWFGNNVDYVKIKDIVSASHYTQVVPTGKTVIVTYHLMVLLASEELIMFSVSGEKQSKDLIAAITKRSPYVFSDAKIVTSDGQKLSVHKKKHRADIVREYRKNAN